MTYEDHDLHTASDISDHRAMTTGLHLADFECKHGNLEPCPLCQPQPLDFNPSPNGAP